MWLDVLISRDVAKPLLREALAHALSVAQSEVLVTNEIEDLPHNVTQKFVVVVSEHEGRFPVLLSIYAAPADRPHEDAACGILGDFAKLAGVTCLVSLEGMPEDELLEISERDRMRIVDADVGDEA